MKVTKNDRSDIITWGAVGLVAAVGYQLTNIFLKQKTNVQDLDPMTESLCEDPELFALFCQLQDFREIDDKHFRLCVDNADRLVFLNKQLQDGQIAPTQTDRTNGYVHYKATLGNFDKYLDNVEKWPDAKAVVQVQNIYSKIFVCLGIHWKGIMRATELCA